MTFNKIKMLSSSQEDIEKELSDDKHRVNRIAKIHLKENIDEYTVYVVSIFAYLPYSRRQIKPIQTF